MTKAEKETIIRWDCEDPVPVMYTSDPAQARRWAKQGYLVNVQDARRDGVPRSWSARGAKGCVRFRRVKDGVTVKRANGAQNPSVHRRFLSGSRPGAPVTPA
jgi:hypothetical protein